MIATLGAVAVVAVVVLALQQSDRIGPDDGQLLIDGEVILPVEADVGRVDSFGGTVTVYHGAAAPEVPALDLAGTEQPLVQDQPKWDENNYAGDVPVVYVGDVNDRSVFVHTIGTIGWFERMQARLGGGEIGVHICMSAGSYEGVNGGVGFCGDGAGLSGHFIKNGPGELETSWASWIDLPEGTSAVQAVVDGEPFLWQRPRGETVFFDLGETRGEELVLVAVDADGNEIAEEDLSISWSSP